MDIIEEMKKEVPVLDIAKKEQLAGNRYASAELYAILSTDNEVSVRFTLANNPMVPKHILKDLQLDDSKSVRDAASKTLKTINNSKTLTHKKSQISI